MATYSSPEDVCNAVIAALGYERRIADLNEGTPAARAFLDIYGQTRDAELCAGMGLMSDARVTPWQFSVAKKLMAAPTKTQTGAYGGNWNSSLQPEPPWQYEWTLPSDYLKALDVLLTPTASGNQLDPKPKRWKIADDNQANANGSKVLLTMDNSPILVYIGQMLDPTTWDPGFTDNVIASLKQKITLALKKDPQLLGPQAQLEDKVERVSGAIQP